MKLDSLTVSGSQTTKRVEQLSQKENINQYELLHKFEKVFDVSDYDENLSILNLKSPQGYEISSIKLDFYGQHVD